MRKSRNHLPSYELRRLSVLAHVDPRTLLKAIRGEPVSPMPLERIQLALREAGLARLLPRRVQRTPCAPRFPTTATTTTRVG
jgi:hypothetical protein